MLFSAKLALSRKGIIDDRPRRGGRPANDKTNEGEKCPF
jgi:hypothetical protein